MNFLFCINNQYCETIKVLIYSLITYNPGCHHFYFIYSNLSLKNQKELTNYTKKLGHLISFHKFNVKIDSLPVNGINWSIEIYFRLFACYILKDVEKILYLDGDIICTGNLSELYKYPCIIAAVENDNQDACKRLSTEGITTYFNSGVFLLNLKQLREMDDENSLLNEIFSLKEKLIFPDQDFLNIKYKKVISPIPKIYNYIISVAEINPNYMREEKPILVHYVMEKPWSIKFPYKTDNLYFKLLWHLNKKTKVIKLLILHRLYRIYQLTLVSKEGRRI
ncbi:glycosyltransferase family 8 protein [Bacteroides stercoris]|uniref:Glycosyltransferase family 8 protein n=1 Tax=Bacteroides stercoris TaxID=46506 RepID=A0A7J5L229_BACSE|nr:glycosyltransferase family 8 protein [Bacteroides stercoris]KAB5261816.1 glycosyltransferase family 8 protein [Bacteroides stercoris]KAB5262097.1 glycosyltransferase family 8 protein [Bacteroides stercoris]KAB5281055.1 glycosyltransferase family 8 protein [Bacteroides stercoris]KAB5282661.1 glycosyltransferase family 8 protein [Bacteroides stercoris]KAB5284460.1 glycosyltransferase family 8 protein [Bacteroides stercoris]